MNIHFRARDIAKVEKTLNMSVENIVADMKTTSLVEMLKVGLIDENGAKVLAGKSEDELYDFIDQQFRETGKVEIMLQVMEALIEAGFLPKELKTANFREKLHDAVETLTAAEELIAD